MPPKTNSRHLFTTAQKRGDDERLYLADRVPFRFVDLSDNRVHTVREGDTLHRIAGLYLASLGQLPFISAANLWWVIADFQPIPIHDPTVQLVRGSKIFVPSVRTVNERILQPQLNV
jgi:hypothetical protein